MELPIEHIVDSVATLRALHDRTAIERRHLPRFPVWAPATVQLAGDRGESGPVEVSLTSLACGGVGFLSPRPLEPGARFYLTLPASDAGTLHTLCEVVHASRGATHFWIVGARFTSTLPSPPASPRPL